VVYTSLVGDGQGRLLLTSESGLPLNGNRHDGGGGGALVPARQNIPASIRNFRVTPVYFSPSAVSDEGRGKAVTSVQNSKAGARASALREHQAAIDTIVRLQQQAVSRLTFAGK